MRLLDDVGEVDGADALRSDCRRPCRTIEHAADRSVRHEENLCSGTRSAARGALASIRPDEAVGALRTNPLSPPPPTTITSGW